MSSFDVTDTYSAETVDAAREWLIDCEWGDVDEDDIRVMPSETIMRAVTRHYDGGIAGFVEDDGSGVPVWSPVAGVS